MESKIPIKGIHDDGPIVSRIDNVSNDTLLQNRINERHRTNSEPKNSPHRSTISPSNNVIDDDYVEKDISRESGDLNSSSNLLRRNSEHRLDAVGKEPKPYKAPQKEVMTVRELIPNTYKIQPKTHDENENDSYDSIQDQNISSEFPDLSSEQLRGMEKKNNSDNEVDDNDYSLKKNVSIDFLLDEQSNEEKNYGKLERPNRTIVNPQNNEDERSNAIFKDRNTKKEISGK